MPRTTHGLVRTKPLNRRTHSVTEIDVVRRCTCCCPSVSVARYLWNAGMSWGATNTTAQNHNMKNNSLHTTTTTTTTTAIDESNSTAWSCSVSNGRTDNLLHGTLDARWVSSLSMGTHFIFASPNVRIGRRAKIVI
jgi:hypothetical protein